MVIFEALKNRVSIEDPHLLLLRLVLELVQPPFQERGPLQLGLAHRHERLGLKKEGKQRVLNYCGFFFAQNLR